MTLLTAGSPAPATDQDLVKFAITPGQPPTDAYVVVTATDLSGVGGTNQSAPGLSVFSHMGDPAALASLRVQVLDGRTLATIATVFPTLPDRMLQLQTLPDSLKHDRWEDYSPAERDRLHAVFLSLITAKVAETLKQLHLSAG
jgi:hypothetical protein